MPVDIQGKLARRIWDSRECLRALTIKKQLDKNYLRRRFIENFNVQELFGFTLEDVRAIDIEVSLREDSPKEKADIVIETDNLSLIVQTKTWNKDFKNLWQAQGEIFFYRKLYCRQKNISNKYVYLALLTHAPEYPSQEFDMLSRSCQNLGIKFLTIS